MITNTKCVRGNVLGTVIHTISDVVLVLTLRIHSLLEKAGCLQQVISRSKWRQVLRYAGNLKAQRLTRQGYLNGYKPRSAACHIGHIGS